MSPDNPSNYEIGINYGTYTAIKNQSGHFMLTIPKKCTDKLGIKGGEYFDVLFDRKLNIISYSLTESKYRPKKIFNDADITVYLGTYSALKSSDKHYLFSIPKYVKERLNIKGEETFTVSLYEKDKTIRYKREIITKPRRRKIS